MTTPESPEAAPAMDVQEELDDPKAQILRDALELGVVPALAGSGGDAEAMPISLAEWQPVR